MIETPAVGTTPKDMLMRFSIRDLLAVCAVMSVAAGCPAEDPASGESGGSSTGVDTGTETDPQADSTTGMADDTASQSTGAADPNCDCVDDDEGFIGFSCDGDEVCAPILVVCPQQDQTDCAMSEMTVANPDELACHHQALADGKVGGLRWELPFVPDPGVAGQRGWIFVREGRAAVTWNEDWDLDAYDWTDTTVVDLQEASYFDDCMTLETAEATFVCLFEQPGQADVAVCVAEHRIPFGG
ncbi:MAG: hypothetical protein K0V04_33485 [Deltaproteobacteria bacterium]|nr:hypothetical protein [Deltaproteobacteria bacterium]